MFFQVCLLMATVDARVVMDGTTSQVNPSIMRGSDILHFTDSIDYSNSAAPVQQTVPLTYTLQLSQPAGASTEENDKQEVRTQYIVQQAPTAQNVGDFKGFSPDQGLTSLRTVPRQGYSLLGASTKTLSGVSSAASNSISGQAVSYIGHSPTDSSSAIPIQQLSGASPVYSASPGTSSNAENYIIAYVPSGSNNVNSGNTFQTLQYSNNPSVISNLQLEYNSQHSIGANKFKHGSEYQSTPNAVVQNQNHFPVQYAVQNQAPQSSPASNTGSEYALQAVGQTLPYTKPGSVNFNSNTNPRFTRLLHTNSLAPGQHSTRLGYSTHSHATQISSPSHDTQFRPIQGVPSSSQAYLHPTYTNPLLRNKLPQQFGHQAANFGDNLGLGSNPSSSEQVPDSKAASGPLSFNPQASEPFVHSSTAIPGSQKGAVIGDGTNTGTIRGHTRDLEKDAEIITGTRHIASRGQDTRHVADRGQGSNTRYIAGTDHNTNTRQVTNPGYGTYTSHGIDTAHGHGIDTTHVTGTNHGTNTRHVTGTDHNTNTKQVIKTGYGTHISHGVDMARGHGADAIYVTGVNHGTNTRHVTGTGHNTNTNFVSNTGYQTEHKGTRQVTSSRLNSDNNFTGMHSAKVTASLAVRELPAHAKTQPSQFPGHKPGIQLVQGENSSTKFAISTSNFVSGNK